MLFSFAPSISEIEIYARRSDVRWQLVEDRVALIDEAEAELVYFNEVGSFIWQRLDGKKSIKAVLHELENTFKAPEKNVRKDTFKFIKQLSQMELIQKVS